MAELIRVSPDVLNSQGGDLINYGGDLREILSQIDSKIQEIDSEWDGCGQRGYTSMYESMKKALDQFPELVETLGQSAQAAAEAFAQVDDSLNSSFSSAM